MVATRIVVADEVELHVVIERDAVAGEIAKLHLVHVEVIEASPSSGSR